MTTPPALDPNTNLPVLPDRQVWHVYRDDSPYNPYVYVGIGEYVSRRWPFRGSRLNIIDKFLIRESTRLSDPIYGVSELTPERILATATSLLEARGAEQERLRRANKQRDLLGTYPPKKLS